MNIKKNPRRSARAILKGIAGPLTFGGMLRSIRMGDALSQAEFAQKLDVSKQNLSDIENNRRNVSAVRAAEWAKILGYGTAQFVRLALQAEVDAAGLDLDVSVSPSRKNKS